MQMLPRQFQLFVLAIVASATIANVLLAGDVSWNAWRQHLLFFTVFVAAFLLRVPDPRGWSLAPTVVLSYLAIYTFDLPTVLLLIGIGWAVGSAISRGWIPWRVMFNGSQGAFSVAIGGVVYALLGGDPGRIDEAPAYLAIFMAPLAYHVANYFFVGYAVSCLRGTPFLSTWLNGVRAFFWPNMLSIPTAVLLAILYARVHYASVVAYLVLLPLQWLAARLYLKRGQLYAQIVDGLVVATDVNFPLGRGHARRVADFAVAIAREMRLSEPAVESVQFAALLHDVGMIGKDDLLERPVVIAKDAEGLQDHVRVGAEIARELPRKEIANMILRHHEKYDGTGYPGAFSGESIPLGARIIALAEAVDSMASGTFPYSSALPSASIVSTIISEKGRAFDPEVVEAFLRTLERGSVAVGGTAQNEDGIAQTPRLGESPAR